jgi:hypothetical protein
MHDEISEVSSKFLIQNSEFEMEKSLCKFYEEEQPPQLMVVCAQTDNLGYLSKVRIIQSCR